MVLHVTCDHISATAVIHLSCRVGVDGLDFLIYLSRIPELFFTAVAINAAVDLSSVAKHYPNQIYSCSDSNGKDH